MKHEYLHGCSRNHGTIWAFYTPYPESKQMNGSQENYSVAIIFV